MKFINKISLRGRISLVTLIILVISLSLFSWLGVQSVNQSVETMLTERLFLARNLAGHLDQTLTYVIVQLQGIAEANNILTDPAEFKSTANSARLTLNRAGIYVNEILLIGENGTVIQSATGDSEIIGLDVSVYPEISDTQNTGLPTISGLVSGYFIKAPAVFINTPILDKEGKVIGVLAGLLDIELSGSRLFSYEARTGQTVYVEIMDSNGVILARTKPGFPPGIFEKSDHPVRFAELINQGKATVGTCHRCHETGGDVEKERDVLAFAPLSVASWGILIRQSEDEALLPTHQLERRLLILGIILLACTLFLVWAIVQGILKPIRTLTLAATKVASGDFDTALPVERGDEIGELSKAFENMSQEVSKSRDELMQHYQEAKHKEEARGHLLNSVISAQEEERKRIARELHDEFGQTLTGLLMTIESLEDISSPEQTLLNKKLAGAKSILVRTLEDIRKLTLDLRPASLDDLGLVSAIRAHLQTHLKDTGIQVKFKHKGASARLNSTIETTIFRIVQEAIHNVIKHAQASHIKIELVIADGKMIVTIEDDGQGFDVDDVYKSKVGIRSLGILGMQERSEILKGLFSIESDPGQGTRIRVEIPVDNSTLPDGEMD